MRYLYILSLLIILGLSFIAIQKDSPDIPNWRADYHTLTKTQFITRWHLIFWHAIQQHCNEYLQCMWEHKHGRVDSLFDFYDAFGCSADTTFFSHFSETGINCDDNKPLTEIILEGTQ